LRVKDGGLADVLVYVKSGLHGSYPSPTEPVLLDQKGCDYWPHMVVKMVGQPLTIRNSDDTLHNIHPRPQINPEFNIGQPHQGMESKKTLDKPEVMIPVGCDVHPWMRAFISVFDHPFFTVTKEDGTFEIKGLPAGEYEIEAYHGKLKMQDQKLTVKDGEAAKLTFSFKGLVPRANGQSLAPPVVPAHPGRHPGPDLHRRPRDQHRLGTRRPRLAALLWDADASHGRGHLL
jgi:hypothetical protein